MSTRPAYGKRLPSWGSLLLLLLAIVILLILWGVITLAIFRLPLAAALQPDALTQQVRDVYSGGLYLTLVCLLLFFWLRWEGRAWKDLGYTFFWRRILEGMGVGVAALGTVYGSAMALGWVQFAAPAAWPPHLLVSALLAGLFIGLVEEGVFRGVLLGTLLRDTPAPVAIGISAMVYALVHFIRPGVNVVASLFPFLGLWMTGVLLGYAAWSRRTLWSSAAIHGTWVCFITLSSQLNLWRYAEATVLWTGNGYPSSGGLTMLAILVALAYFRWRSRRPVLGRLAEVDGLVV